jgi:hypothetical protein
VGDKFVFVNAPRTVGEKLANTTWWMFARGLGVPNPGTLPELVGWLRAHAAPDDVLVTNLSWDNLYFYTNLRQVSFARCATPRALRPSRLRVRTRCGIG